MGATTGPITEAGAALRAEVEEPSPAASRAAFRSQPGFATIGSMGSMTTTAPVRERAPEEEDVAQPDIPWIVIVWNDPINLMSYVVFVFQKLFGYSKDKATKLMLDVHLKGKAVVSSGPREKAEYDVYRLHSHGLWATMQKDR
jgi:ATP-dependent Clp protease adaptor protein ClpS